MFLGQVEHKDVMADGCAASMYHGAMQANNATSELHLVPEHEQRCFAIGQADVRRERESSSAIACFISIQLHAPHSFS